MHLHVIHLRFLFLFDYGDMLVFEHDPLRCISAMHLRNFADTYLFIFCLYSVLDQVTSHYDICNF